MSTDRKSGKFGFRISSIFNQPHIPSTTSPTKKTPSIPLRQAPKPPINKPITQTQSHYIPQRTPSPPTTTDASKVVAQRGITQTPPRSPGSPLRRKQPPPIEEPELLYFNTPNIVKTSPSPASPQATDQISERIADFEASNSPMLQQTPEYAGINYNVMTTLEHEIDHFLNVTGDNTDDDYYSPVNNRIANIQYDDSSSSSSSTKPLNTTGSSSSMGHDSDFHYVPSQSISPMSPVGETRGTGPYPVDYPVENSNIQLPLQDPESIESPHNAPLENELGNPISPSSRSSTPEQALKMSMSVSTPTTQAQRSMPMTKSKSETTRRYPSTPSSQFTRSPSSLTQVQPQRAFVNPLPESMNIPLSKSNTMTTTLNSASIRSKHRRQSSSISSIMSSNSYRNVNLAQLKKTLNLKPGEGERSNYVWSIRRSAGTAFNENGPSRWKLPVGILPVDKTALYENSNGRYLGLGGGVTSSRKKTSGVELKHGHLKPRLLAAEIDEDDDNGLQLTSNTPPISTHSTTTATSSRSGENKSSDSGKVSRENSLARTVTDISIGNSLQSMEEEIDNTTKLDSMSTSSNDSVSEKLAFTTGFYQHRGFREDKDESKESANMTDVEGNTMMNDYGQSYSDLTNMDGYEERPRLYLANPDTDTDSE